MIGRRNPPNILNDWRLPVFAALLRVVYHDLAVGDLNASAVKHQLDFPVQGPQGRIAEVGRHIDGNSEIDGAVPEGFHAAATLPSPKAFSAIEDWSSAGYFFTAVGFAAISLISKRRVLLEVSCYIGVLALAYLFESLYYLSAYGTPNPYSLLNVITNESSSSLFNTRFDYIAVMRSINALTLGATMAGFSLARERNAKSTPRLIIAYILVTVSYPGTLLGTESTAHMVLSIIFVIVEIGFLIIGALTKRKWLVIASAIAATLMSLRLTSSLGNAVSLLIIGVVIIAIVIWQMVSNNKKPTQVEQPQQEQKAIEESSSTEEKTEESVESKANEEEKEDR